MVNAPPPIDNPPGMEHGPVSESSCKVVVVARHHELALEKPDGKAEAHVVPQFVEVDALGLVADVQPVFNRARVDLHIVLQM